MRMRRLVWAPEYIKNSKVVVKKPEANINKWNDVLNCECIHLEIGSGKGDYWIQMGNMYLDVAWIGMEKNESVAALALRKYDEEVINNLHMAFIYDDASKLEEIFGANEIDVIHLNFSDPWPKKRTHKRRLSSPLFLKQYASVLKSGGLIIMKSDNKDLFEYSLTKFETAGWICLEKDYDYRGVEHREDAISEYEAKFMQKGQCIHRAIWQNK